MTHTGKFIITWFEIILFSLVDGIKLKTMFEESPELENMIKSGLEATPEVMYMLEEAILHPEKV